jgi:hypothetical protein
VFKFLAALLSLAKELLSFIDRKDRERIAADTPEERAKNDQAKMEQAIADGDVAVINDLFHKLREDHRKAGNNGG